MNSRNAIFEVLRVHAPLGVDEIAHRAGVKRDVAERLLAEAVRDGWVWEYAVPGRWVVYRLTRG